MVLKKEIIERYLTNFTKQPTFTVEDLINLTANDLFGRAELEGTGKTTISTSLSAFKKKYVKNQYNVATSSAEIGQFEDKPGEIKEENVDDLSFTEKDFEDVVINAIEKVNKTERNKIKPETKESVVTQKPIVTKSPNVTVEIDNFNSSDIQIIKQMIQQYQSGHSTLALTKNLELIELKQALKFLGIDYKIIQELYRKSV